MDRALQHGGLACVAERLGRLERATFRCTSRSARAAVDEVGRPMGGDCCSLAAQGGHLEMLQWLLQQGCPCSQDALHTASGAGRLEVLQWLASHPGWRPQDILRQSGAMQSTIRAAQNVCVLEWLLSEGCPASYRVWEQAAAFGRLGVLQWAHANQHLARGCGSSLLESAALGGNVQVMEWIALVSDCPVDGEEEVCRLAAERGQLRALQWLVDRGHPVGSVTWGAARQRAARGDGQVLQWLREWCPGEL